VGQGTDLLVADPGRPTILTDFLEGVWSAVTVILRQGRTIRTETIDPAQRRGRLRARKGG
jgi:two-component system, OmpR family, sensor histidine kinase ChvG